MQLGIFGGTFDPIHLGHLIVAEMAREELRLDRVLFMLALQPPHKQAAILSPWQERLAMLQIALAEHPGFDPSTLELERGGTSFTVDTLRALHELPATKQAQLYLIIGQDGLAGFHTWHEPEKILELAKLVVYPRAEARAQNASFPELCPHLLNAPVIEISSSDIRRRVQEGHSIRYLVPEAVRRHIAARKLYV